jgi:hypothetical protein
LDNDEMKRVPAILAVIWFLPALYTAHAQLTMTLTPATRNATLGTELVFSGALTNTSETNALFLNDIQAALTGTASNRVNFNANSFFANVPGLLLPGEIYTGAVFRVLLLDTAGGDYEGSVTLQGGDDVFATNDLASAAFVASSTTVNIAASDLTASEFGPDPGAFTISRAGGTNTDLTVFYAISGSATNGIAYSPIPSSLLIPAGASAVTITLTPIPDNLAQGKRTATLTLSASPSYNLGSNVAATISIHDKPFDIWRLQKFGAAADSPLAADMADWDSDGIQNLVEYALNLEPTIPNTRALAVPQIVEDHLTWSYVPNPAAVDVEPVVEGSTDLLQWNTADVEIVVVPDPDPPGRVTVRYRQPVTFTDHAFLRLRARRVQQ